jgi:hypothetical protein
MTVNTTEGLSDYTTTLWHGSHNCDSYDQFVERCRATDHEVLARIASNTLLNDWCGDVADYSQTESDSRKTDPHGHGKRLPYVGWYWRSIDFAGANIPVGNCGDFIGFMANNKWDYPERDLDPEEAAHVIDLLWRARTASGQGGLLSEAWAARDTILTELWDWMQTLTIEPRMEN